MNIFAVDDNPVVAAMDLCDQHVVKMIVESAQLLSTVAHSEGRDAPYKPTHKGNPLLMWVAHPANWSWLLQHAYALGDEYTRRYKKVHKTSTLLSYFVDKDNWRNHTPFLQVMPPEFKGPDSVEAYRKFYRETKTFARWRHSPKPEWMTAHV